MRPTREGAAVGVGTALVLVVLVWRATLGIGLGDDGHVIALALRLSQGDLPFRDEMNVQALGAVWAAPLAWLWTHLVGLGGLVLVTRIGYLAAGLGAAAASYRALRTSFRPVVAATGVAMPFLAPPYNLLDPSYNTAPIALGVLALCAAHAAIARAGTPGGRRWAVAAGAATAAAVFSNPLVLGAGVVLLVAAALLARRRDVVLPLAAGAGAVLVIALALFAAAGLSSIRATLDYAARYRDTGDAPAQRLSDQVAAYRLYAWRPRFLPAALLAALSALPRLPPRVRAVALTGAVVAGVAPSFFAFGQRGAIGRVGTRPAMGVLPGVPLVLLALLLVVPVVAWAVRRRRRDVGTLLALGLPAAAAGVPAVAVGTLSTPVWGAAVIGAAPAVVALTVGWSVMILGAWRGLGRVACAALVAAVLALLVLTPYRDPFPWQLRARLESGVFAGLATTPENARSIRQLQGVVRRWTRPGDGVLFYGIPGGYLLADTRVDSNLEWLIDYGNANRATLAWFDRTGRRPDVAVVAGGIVARAGGLAGLARTDPLVAYLLQGYRVAQSGGDAPTVLVRR